MEKLIILHDSLLPKYRGFSPLVTALINGEKRIGVTAIFGDKQYDTGPIITQSSRNINYPITIKEAITIINEIYLDVGTYVLNTILVKKIASSTPQNESQASYSAWRDDDDYRIDWNKSSHEIERFINAVGKPYKGAFTKTSTGETVRINAAISLADVSIENRDTGKVLFLELGYPIIICKSGLLKILDATIESNGTRLPLIPLHKFRTKFC
jgi:methionyl-tRNA formyltransferase